MMMTIDYKTKGAWNDEYRLLSHNMYSSVTSPSSNKDEEFETKYAFVVGNINVICKLNRAAVLQERRVITLFVSF